MELKVIGFEFEEFWEGNYVILSLCVCVCVCDGHVAD